MVAVAVVAMPVVSTVITMTVVTVIAVAAVMVARVLRPVMVVPPIGAIRLAVVVPIVAIPAVTVAPAVVLGSDVHTCRRADGGAQNRSFLPTDVVPDHRADDAAKCATDGGIASVSGQRRAGKSKGHRAQQRQHRLVHVTQLL
jgi:hypothetical protein